MDTQKVQLNFSQKAINDLDQLKEDIGTSSRAETVRLAVNMMRWISDESKKGNIFCIERGGVIEKVKILMF